MTTYYHVTWGDWDGEDLKCFNARIEDGEDVVWHWDDADYGYDGDLVSLYRGLASAIEFRNLYRPAGEILRVDLPDDDDERARLGVVVVRDSDGYLAIPARIPTELITRAHA